MNWAWRVQLAAAVCALAACRAAEPSASAPGTQPSVTIVAAGDIAECPTGAAAGSMAAARSAGKLRQEGKTYVVVDGDIINVKFNL